MSMRFTSGLRRDEEILPTTVYALTFKSSVLLVWVLLIVGIRLSVLLLP